MNIRSHPHRDELIVVTGASTGIGAATVKRLAQKGFHVLAGVRREVDAEAFRDLDVRGIEPVLLDITVEADIAAVTERVACDPRHRPLRALVNNAGIAINAPVETLPIAQWRQQFEVNLFGHIAMTQALLPALLEQLGHRRQYQFGWRQGGVADLRRLRRFQVRAGSRQRRTAP